MSKRIFIAVNLPESAKRKIEQEVERLRPLFYERDTRFLPSENWHLTLSFLAYQSDDSIGKIVSVCQRTAKIFSSPKIVFEKIVYGPPGKISRMIWLSGSPMTSRGLTSIKDELENELYDAGVRFRREERQFKAHLTLARFEAAPRGALPEIEKKWPLAFKAKTLDLMESHLKRSGAQYEILNNFAFGSPE